MHIKKISLPPTDFMQLVCGGNHENIAEHFEWAGELLLRMLDEEKMISGDTDFLDVGCGCGRVARHLLNEPVKSCTGFDRHAGMINWCQENITAHAPNFRFHCFEIKSAYSDMDGHEGKIEAASFCFPFADCAFDAILLASVFTHMPMKESRNYLKELRRVLRPGGKILLSVFFSDSEPYSKHIDFYYNRKAFLDAVQDAGFDCRFREELYTHHWFVLG